MKRIRIIILFLASILLFSKCNIILKAITGVRNIKSIKVEKLKDFCINSKIDLTNVYIFRLKNDSNRFPDSTQINFRYLDKVLVFNSDGNQMIYYGKAAGYYCSSPKKNFFSDLNSPFLPVDTSQNLFYLLKNYRNIASDLKPNIEKADYYIIYYWALWYKSYSKRTFKEINSILESADTSLKIQCFYLNNDLVDINYPKNIDFKNLKINLMLDK